VKDGDKVTAIVNNRDETKTGRMNAIVNGKKIPQEIINIPPSGVYFGVYIILYFFNLFILFIFFSFLFVSFRVVMMLLTPFPLFPFESYLSLHHILMMEQSV
jgi:hypothetical protein